MFKILCMNELNDDCLPCFSRAVSGYTRGHKFKLIKGSCKLNLRKYYFTNRLINLWNDLPEIVVMSNRLFEFKKRLDNY